MSPEQQMVQEFHRKYDAPVGDAPRQISVKDRLRRARLIVSEAGEFLDAADKSDFIEMVDALADILPTGPCCRYSGYPSLLAAGCHSIWPSFMNTTSYFTFSPLRDIKVRYKQTV